jgi:hypothetical protein
VSASCFLVGFDIYEYEGECRDGFAHGRGKASTPGLAYEGEFVGGLLQGRGKLVYMDGKPGVDGYFANNEAATVKAVPEALFVCSRPDAAGRFRCDSPERAGLPGQGSPEAMLASAGDACPSKRRLPSRTHVVWGCGFGATNTAKAMDRGEGVDLRGRGTYHCLEREVGCKRTEVN